MTFDLRAFGLLFLLACGTCDDDAATPEAEDTPTAVAPEAPADLLLEACAAEGRGALQEALGPLASGWLLEADTRAALVEISEEAGPFASHVEPRAAMCAIALRGDAPDPRLIAAPLSSPVDGGEPGAPAEGRWLSERVAVIGNALVVGSSRVVVERAGAYAALVALPAEREELIEVSVPDGVVAQRGRPFATDALQQVVRDMRAGIAAEEAERGRPPELGDPTALVDALDGFGRDVVDALSDVGSVRSTLDVDGSSVVLTVQGELREGSPFAERARAWPAAPHGFESLPQGTAVAYFRAGLVEGETGLADHLQAMAGERLGAAEREALATTSAAVRGAPRTLAFGGNEHGAFALWRARGADLGTLAAPLRRAFAAGYLATLASAASGCEGSGSRIAGRATGRCPEAPVGALRDSSFVVAHEGQLVLLEDGPSDPAIARLVTDDAPVVAALLVRPSALPAALRLVKALPPLGSLPSGGALLLTLRVTDGTLTLTARGTSEAIRALFTLLDA